MLQPSEPCAAKSLVDEVGPGRLSADVEGLSIYRRAGQTGYLLVSSQGDSSFHAYDLDADLTTAVHRGRFEIAGSGAIDSVSETDGIEISSLNFGADFPAGLMVAQDGVNDSAGNLTDNLEDKSQQGENQNFKVIDWREIEQALGLGVHP